MARAVTVNLALLSLVTAATIAAVPARAEAAGTITIEQKSQIEQYGGWRLTTPKGTIVNQKKERVMSVSAEQGQYLLNVEPPEGAWTTIRFYDGNALLNTTEGTQVSFLFSGNGTLRAEISFVYEGVIIVESVPSGAHFELKGPQGVRQAGTTPATFTNIPPFYFTVSYSPTVGCLQPKPQSRTLRPNSTLRFHADYTCADEIKTVTNTLPPENGVPASTATTPATARMLEELSHANVQLFHSINQEETVAGSTVYVTLGVRNVSKSTIRSITLSEQFDAATLSLPEALQGGGIVRGNTAIWEIPQILAGQSFSVMFPVRMSEDVREGTEATLIARVSGDDVHAPQGELLTKRVSAGIVSLPATGGAVERIFILLSLVGGALAILNPRNRRKPIVVPTAFRQ